MKNAVPVKYDIGKTGWRTTAQHRDETIGGNHAQTPSIKLAISYEFTPCAPLESLTINTSITDVYYANLTDQLAA